jgi:hypothetical protein
MKLIATLLLLYGLAHALSNTQTTPHTYQTPSCHGIAAVPGYEKCKP